MPVGTTYATKSASSKTKRLATPSTVKSGAANRASNLSTSLRKQAPPGFTNLDQGPITRADTHSKTSGITGVGSRADVAARQDDRDALRNAFSAASGSNVAAAAAAKAPLGGGTGANVVGVGGQGQGQYTGDPFTGFAANFAPGLANQIFDTPGIALAKMLEMQGMPTDGGLYYTMEPLADVANQLFLLQNAGVTGSGSNESAINWMGEFFKQMMTQGGRGVDLGQGFGALLNSGEGNPLADLLNVQDNRGQVQNMVGLVNDLLTAGMHPLMAQAVMASMNKAGNSFLQSTAQGTGGYDGNFQDFLRQNYGQMLGRF